MPPRKPKGDRPPKQPRAKKETAVKRETRSRHEKKRREEMNEVLSEMAELLPEEVISSGKLKKVDQKPRNPDKCFIIGNSVEMIRNSDYKPGLLSEPLTVDVFKITNSFMIFMHDFIVAGIEGDHRCIFDVEKDRMLGRDIRCFLDFESASKLPFLDPNLLIHQLQMKSFMAKAMSCIIKNSQENPSESILICVPNELPRIVPPPQAPPTFVQLTPPKSPPPSKLEVERPILAALLRKKDPPKPTFLEISPMPPSTSSTFLSPTSSTCSTVPLTTVTTPRRVTVVPPKRKRIRSMNVIVESYPLDEKDEEEETPAVKRQKKRQSAPNPPIHCNVATASTNTVSMPTTSMIRSVPPTNTMGVNPFEVLAPGYRDIWLRLQSERLLLEERISAKEGELKNLMQFVHQPTPLLNFPNYLLPQSSNQ